jgi:hypothetical protein
MEDLKELEYLAIKSKELLEKQVNSYRQRHNNSGTIITVLALFVPFFLNGLDNSYLIIKLLSLIPIGFLILAIVFLIQVLSSKPLYQGLNFPLIDLLVNYSYEDILLNEIGANKDSFNDNQIITADSNSKYNKAIKFTQIAIISSSLLLLSNQFFKPENDVIMVKITNPINMSNDNKEKSGDDKKAETTPKVRVIPSVGPKFRVVLNEGKGKPDTKSSDKKSGKK